MLNFAVTSNANCRDVSHKSQFPENILRKSTSYSFVQHKIPEIKAFSAKFLENLLDLFSLKGMGVKYLVMGVNFKYLVFESRVG